VRPIKQVARSAVSLLTEPVRAYPKVLHGLRHSAASTAEVSAVELFNIVTSITMVTQASLQFAHGLFMIVSNPVFDSPFENLAMQPCSRASRLPLLLIDHTPSRGSHRMCVKDSCRLAQLSFTDSAAQWMRLHVHQVRYSQLMSNQ
jgi:hypothetical protein